MNRDSVSISTSERRRIVWLLGQYQELLEGAVDAVIVPGTNEANPHCGDDVRVLAAARLQWSRAERAIAKLTEAKTA